MIFRKGEGKEQVSNLLVIFYANLGGKKLSEIIMQYLHQCHRTQRWQRSLAVISQNESRWKDMRNIAPSIELVLCTLLQCGRPREATVLAIRASEKGIRLAPTWTSSLLIGLCHLTPSRTFEYITRFQRNAKVFRSVPSEESLRTVLRGARDIPAAVLWKTIEKHPSWETALLYPLLRDPEAAERAMQRVTQLVSSGRLSSSLDYQETYLSGGAHWQAILHAVYTSHSLSDAILCAALSKTPPLYRPTPRVLAQLRRRGVLVQEASFATAILTSALTSPCWVSALCVISPPVLLDEGEVSLEALRVVVRNCSPRWDVALQWFTRLVVEGQTVPDAEVMALTMQHCLSGGRADAVRSLLIPLRAAFGITVESAR